jgi:hypothetical protein
VATLALLAQLFALAAERMVPGGVLVVGTHEKVPPEGAAEAPTTPSDPAGSDSVLGVVGVLTGTARSAKGSSPGRSVTNGAFVPFRILRDRA